MEFVEKTVDFVKEKLHRAEAGHDWFHTERVWKLARKIAAKENADILVVELAALLHDVADSKFHEGDEYLAITISDEFLKSIDLPDDRRHRVLFIIKHNSFKNRSELPEKLPLELQIVQDADRLDAIGAIGIARTFHFGGYRNNLLYHPEIAPNLNMTKEEYKKTDGTTINHFYEKLLLLKKMMHTETAKQMAEKRHSFMLDFLDEFYREWNLE